MGHGVGQYQVWVVGSQLGDVVESAYCALSADERSTVGAVVDLAKDDIEFLGRLLVVRVHDNSTPCMPFAMCSHTPFRPSAPQWYRNTRALTASSVHVLLLPDATLPDRALDGPKPAWKSRLYICCPSFTRVILSVSP